MAATGVAFALAGFSVQTACATLGGDAPPAPKIIGGQPASIAQYPWQVYVEAGPFEEGGRTFSTTCGGSILNATTILTAAHCTDAEGTTSPEPAEKFVVLAGDSTDGAPAGRAQVRGVASIRRDPLYRISPTSNDVAILTLRTPLQLSGELSTQAIALVATGQTPSPGTTVSISGYGKEQAREGEQPTGDLNATTLTVLPSASCLGMTGAESATLLCAGSATSATCKGDSGGPLTEGDPPVQVGIVDYGLKECPLGQPDVFTNIAAPEIREFIERGESPPIAPRRTLRKQKPKPGRRFKHRRGGRRAKRHRRR